ncbi:IS4 family transposase [Virgibacillus kimchii]
MDKDNTKTTINELLKIINEQTFTKLINVIDLDKYVKKLTAHKFLQLLIIAHINEVDSLAHLTQKVKDDDKLNRHMGFDISTSQLSRKLGALSPKVFEKVFHHLVFNIHARQKGQPISQQISRLHVIDSTTMSMSLTQYPWATFRKTKAGVRLHLQVVVTKDMVLPDSGVLTPAKHADRTQMNELIEIVPDAVYLFDRGYNDYKQFDKLCMEKVRFITRLKKNAEVKVLQEYEANPDSLIFKDQKVILGKGKNQMTRSLRLIETEDSEGNTVIIITNCFHLSANEIGDLYRYRWKIETFFKWMKQHLHLKTFYGKSENAVYNQIWIALITYCLELLMQRNLHHKGSLLDVHRKLQTNLFEGLDKFIRSLFRKPERTSKGRRANRWEREFKFIERQFALEEVSHLNDLTFDPLF